MGGTIEAAVEVREVSDDRLYGFVLVGPIEAPDMGTRLGFSREGANVYLWPVRNFRTPRSSEWDAAELALRGKLEAADYEYDRLVRRVGG